MNLVAIKPPSSKACIVLVWYITGQVKLLCNLPVTTLNDIEFYKSISSENSSNCDPKFETQRTAEWFNARKGKLMKAIMTAKALRWYGKKATIE